MYPIIRKTYKIAVIPGDGIGTEVIAAGMYHTTRIHSE